jgi:hypothetical protein
MRTIEIHPRRFVTLNIEKFDGVASFTLNRCLVSEKKDCFDQLDRVDPNKMTSYIERVRLDECSSCIVLVKVEGSAKLRMSIDAEL